LGRQFFPERLPDRDNVRLSTHRAKCFLPATLKSKGKIEKLSLINGLRENSNQSNGDVVSYTYMSDFGQGPSSPAAEPSSALLRDGLVLGHPPACDQDGRNDQQREEGEKGDAKHECRGLQFFNLFCVVLEVNHFTETRLRCVRATHT